MTPADLDRLAALVERIEQYPGCRSITQTRWIVLYNSSEDMEADVNALFDAVPDLLRLARLGLKHEASGYCPHCGNLRTEHALTCEYELFTPKAAPPATGGERTDAKWHQPGLCHCQGDDPTLHKHYPDPPHRCARCGKCAAFAPRTEGDK